MSVPLSKLKLDGGTQPRAELNPDTVNDYVDAMRQGDQFPPPVVYHDGANYWLADGFHRLAAYRLVDPAAHHMICDIRQGTQRDAVLYSVAANATHGLKRSNEDKRRAVIKLLEDEEWSQWSDRKIAEVTKTSHPFVGKLRAELYPESASTPRTVQRGDQEYTLASGNISRSNADRAAITPADVLDQIRTGNNTLNGLIDHFKVAKPQKSDTLGYVGANQVADALGQLKATGQLETVGGAGTGTPGYYRQVASAPASPDPTPAATTTDYRADAHQAIADAILTALASGGKRLSEIMKSVPDDIKPPAFSFGRFVDDLVGEGEIVKSGGMGKPVVYALPGLSFDGVCDAILTALASGPLSRESLRLTAGIAIDHDDLLTRAIAFQHSAQRIKKRRPTPDELASGLALPDDMVYELDTPKPQPAPVTPGNIQRFEQAKRNGQATYNGIPYESETDPAARREMTGTAIPHSILFEGKVMDFTDAVSALFSLDDPIKGVFATKSIQTWHTLDPHRLKRVRDTIAQARGSLAKLDAFLANFDLALDGIQRTGQPHLDLITAQRPQADMLKRASNGRIAAAAQEVLETVHAGIETATDSSAQESQS